MPNRILKESLTTSASVDDLAHEDTEQEGPVS